MFWNLVRLEAAKVLRPPLLWIGLAGLAGLSGAFFSLFFAARGNIPTSGTRILYWPGSLQYGLEQATGYQPATSFGVLLTIIVVGVVTAREHSWRTWQLWLGRGISRPALVAAGPGPAPLRRLTARSSASRQEANRPPLQSQGWVFPPTGPPGHLPREGGGKR
jgi:hypothetical protein